MSSELSHPRPLWAPTFQWRVLLRPATDRLPARALTGFVGAWLALVSIHVLMPLPAGLTVAGKATLAVMAWAAVIWIFEALPVAVSGLLIPALLVLTKAVTPMAKAANGYTNPVVFLGLVAFLFSAIMQCAGLDRRIALGLLDKVKVKTVNGVIWTMFGVNLVLSFVVPAANARAATLLPVINGLTRLFGDTEQERNAETAIAIQSLVYGSMISGMCILTAHLPNLVITGLFSSELHIRISYPSRTASNMAKKFAGGTGRPILSFAATPMATPTASRSMSATCATARSGSKAASAATSKWAIHLSPIHSCTGRNSAGKLVARSCWQRAV